MSAGSYRSRLDDLVERWGLIPAGAPLVTHASCLLPATRDGHPVMLKTSAQTDEIRGFALLQWWDGDGAVRVLERVPDAVLMERASGDTTLVRMSESGHDDEAIAIMCQALGRLHQAGSGFPPPLVLLSEWFESLFACETLDPFMERGKALAAELLAGSGPSTVLHGDMHHGNVVRMAHGEWVAIDPQGLFGNRAYDYANIFRNPNLAIAADPGRFRARLALVSARSGIAESDLLKWVAALCSLSASWGEDTELPEGTDRIIAELALSHLDALG